MKSFPVLLSVLAAIVGVTTTQAQERAKITFGWTPGPDVPAVALAIDENLWAAEGLEVNVVKFPSGAQAMQALIGGQLDLASVGELPAVIGAMRQQSFRILADVSRYQGNRIIVASDSPVTTRDLDKRKIGVTIGTGPHFMLERELAKAGVKAEIVNAAPPDLLPALSRGDIDAAFMFPTFYAGTKVTLGKRYQEIMTPDSPTHFLLIGTTSLVSDRTEVVKKFLNALLQAEKQATANPAAAQEAISRVVGKVLSPDAIRLGWSEYNFGIRLDDTLMEIAMLEGAWLKDRGFVKNVEPTQELFRKYISGEALKSVAPDRVQLK